MAILALAVVSAASTKLLALALGLEAKANGALPGFVLAALMIPLTAPRSLKQLGVIMAVVAAGGAVANLTGLVAGHLAEDQSGRLLVRILAAALGAGFVVLTGRYLGVAYRRFPPENRA